MASKYHNLSDYDINSVPDGKGMKVGIVVSEWNKEITGALLDGAMHTLMKHGVEETDIKVKTVPGSFELVHVKTSASFWLEVFMTTSLFSYAVTSPPCVMRR